MELCCNSGFYRVFFYNCSIIFYFCFTFLQKHYLGQLLVLINEGTNIAWSACSAFIFYGIVLAFITVDILLIYVNCYHNV